MRLGFCTCHGCRHPLGVLNLPPGPTPDKGRHTVVGIEKWADFSEGLYSFSHVNLRFLRDFSWLEIRSFPKMWVDLESVIQSEVSQKEENKYHILTPICEI